MATNEKMEEGEATLVPTEDAHVVLRVVDVNDELFGQLTVTREDEASTVTIVLTHTELLALSKGITQLVELTDE